MNGVEEIGYRMPSGALLREMKVPYVRSPLYDEMPAPRTFAELMVCLEGITWSSGHPGCWRGQADIAWPMDCTAARRLKLSHQDLDGSQDFGFSLESWVRRYEDRLLQQARMAGHGFLDGRTLSDLELLSVLRHYGAATRLMDFSRNAFVALWFACRSHPQEYGLLACLDSTAVRTIKREETLRATVTLLLDKPRARERFFLWEPRHLFERMRVQQSIFVFGKVEHKRWGTAPFKLGDPSDEEGNSDLQLFAISPQLKEDALRTNWQVFFGYDAKSLFPDISGFGSYHAPTEDFESDFFG